MSKGERPARPITHIDEVPITVEMIRASRHNRKPGKASAPRRTRRKRTTPR